MKFTIEWLESKTTPTGKPVKNATLKNETGYEVEKVSIWADFPGWNDLRPGSTVEGDIRQNAKGYKSLAPIKSAPSVSRPASGVVTAAKITSESVEKAQANKNASIAFFNATNNAIALLEAYGGPDGIAGESTEEFIVRWRDWFLKEWQEYEASDLRDKTKPF